MSWQLRRLPVCASTEIELDRWLERRQAAGMSLQRLAVTARRQRFGHGQQGRPWLSPAGGIWLSAAIPWAGALPGTSSLGLAVAVGLAQQLEALGLAVQLKWPNDLLVCGSDTGIHNVNIDALARQCAKGAISVQSCLGLIDAVKVPGGAYRGRERH